MSMFIISHSFLTVAFSAELGVEMNLAANERPDFFSTALWTTPKAPLSIN
jgi:hypothetical protein